MNSSHPLVAVNEVDISSSVWLSKIVKYEYRNRLSIFPPYGTYCTQRYSRTFHTCTRFTKCNEIRQADRPSTGNNFALVQALLRKMEAVILQSQLKYIQPMLVCQVLYKNKTNYTLFPTINH